MLLSSTSIHFLKTSSRIRKPGEKKVSKGPGHPAVWKPTALLPIPLQGQREDNDLSCFSVSARGKASTLQVPLLKCLSLRQGEDIKTLGKHLLTTERHSQVWMSPQGKNIFPKASPSPLHAPDALGFPLPRAAPDSPSRCAPGSYLCRVFS